MNLLAHVRWFISDNPKTNQVALNYEEFFIIAIAVLAGVIGLLLLSQSKPYKRFGRWADKKFRKLGKWVPTLTRVSVGLILVLNAWSGYYFAPNIEVTSGTIEYLSWLSAGLGILLIAGAYVRLSAAALGLIYLVSFSLIDGLQLLEHVEYLAIAIFLIICGGGKLTPKRLTSHELEELGYYQAWALPALRIGTGISLATLAFSEKLLNVHAAQEFLYKHDWNFLSGLGASDRAFIIIAGTVELIVGLSLVFNAASRLVTFIVLLLFIVTASLLGVEEVIGHLFAIGVVAAVWANFPRPVKYKQVIKAGAKSGKPKK